MGPSPAVAEIRNAVREFLTDLVPGDLVLAACSGGADSLALAAALAFVAPRLGLRAGGVTVDHGLQPGSAERAAEVAAVLTGLGLDPVENIAVTVPGAGGPAGVGDRGPAGDPDGNGREGRPEAQRRPQAQRRPAGYGGPEAAARAARYRALESAARRTGAVAVLLGHTLDDQAETVLLGLARGSGARSLAGMAARRGQFVRPLLGVRRTVTRAACEAAGLRPWDDPHNADPRFSRARVRHDVMPVLEAALGPGVAEALARTAGLLRADADFLDALAGTEAERTAGGAQALLTDSLAGLPSALRTRVLHAAAVAAGCPPGALTARHVRQLEALVTGWRGQRWADLPGGVRAFRREGQLRFTNAAPESALREQPAGAGEKTGVTNDVPGRDRRDREGGHGRGRHGSGPEAGADQPGAAAGAGGGAGGAH